MKTINLNIKSDRKVYKTPSIESIIIDNEISLILSSTYNPIDIGDPGDECMNNGFSPRERNNNNPYTRA